MNIDLEAMKAAAHAATQRPWHRQQVGSPGYYRIMVGEHNALPMSGDAGHANSAHIVAAQPAAVLALIERLERAEAAIRKQAAAATAGMDEAKRGASIMLQEAQRVAGQSNPEALASERAANAMLTEENERLQRELEAAEAALRAIYVKQQDKAVRFPPGVKPVEIRVAEPKTLEQRVDDITSRPINAVSVSLIETMMIEIRQEIEVARGQRSAEQDAVLERLQGYLNQCGEWMAGR